MIESGRHRIQRLLPIRYARMNASSFAFLRGAAAIMAADLAATPASGLAVQAGGDCHLANFGTYASPEGTPVFDLNDFDETLAAPFEWDVKRLAASFAVAARSRRMNDKQAGGLARAAAGRIANAWRCSPGWGHCRSGGPASTSPAYSASIGDTRLRGRETRRLHGLADANRAGYPQLLERIGGELRIKVALPYTVPLVGQADPTLEHAARAAFHSYRASLREDQRLLMDRYRLSDLAFKVVGVGSVGTFCAIGLFTTADGDTLLLQLKEAQLSALAPHAGPSPYANQGRRVVMGQRIMQAVSDPLLGWTDDDGDDRPCYVASSRTAAWRCSAGRWPTLRSTPTPCSAARRSPTPTPVRKTPPGCPAIWAGAARSTPPSRSSPCPMPTRPSATTGCSRRPSSPA